MKTSYDIIREPVITETSDKNRELGKYTFLVRTDACKIEIKNAVEKIFKVDVTKVNVMNVKGKTRRRGFRHSFKEPFFKK